MLMFEAVSALMGAAVVVNVSVKNVGESRVLVDVRRSRVHGDWLTSPSLVGPNAVGRQEFRVHPAQLVDRGEALVLAVGARVVHTWGTHGTLREYALSFGRTTDAGTPYELTSVRPRNPG